MEMKVRKKITHFAERCCFCWTIANKKSGQVRLGL